jgi:2,4-dienoyl-CoA reductase-like NADH-dependent reductase (Old Yellow Enzyme family)
MRDPRYDILFEPVKIGPVTARNRFYQVPHCNGMGYRDPSGEAYMRQVKAEGGWAVVCTEQVEIHPTSDIGPFIELRLWDDQDLPALTRISEKIHEGGGVDQRSLTRAPGAVGPAGRYRLGQHRRRDQRPHTVRRIQAVRFRPGPIAARAGEVHRAEDDVDSVVRQPIQMSSMASAIDGSTRPGR